MFMNKFLRYFLTYFLFFVCLNNFSFTQEVDSETLYKQANEFYKNSNYDKAKKIYLQILEKEPEFVKAYYGLGSVFYAEKNFTSAIEYYKKAVEKNDKFAEAYEWLGNSYEKLNNYEEAVKNWEQSLKLKPNNLYLQKNWQGIMKKVNHNKKILII
jgi:tetratricopeptide (TPR) repeat protein